MCSAVYLVLGHSELKPCGVAAGSFAGVLPEERLQLERALLQVSVAARSRVLHRLLCRGGQRSPALECNCITQLQETEKYACAVDSNKAASFRFIAFNTAACPDAFSLT